MSGWTGTAQAFLDAGGTPTFYVGVWVFPRLRGGALADPFGFWTGSTDEVLTVSGDLRAYIGADQNLAFDMPRFTTGTQVRRTSCSLIGLTEEAAALYRTYDLTQCRAEVHRFMEGPGGTILGTWRDVNGLIEASDLEIPPESEASVTLNIASFSMAGTRVISAKKSHESYKRRDGDTSMEYASVRDEEDDEWITT